MRTSFFALRIAPGAFVVALAAGACTLDVRGSHADDLSSLTTSSSSQAGSGEGDPSSGSGGAGGQGGAPITDWWDPSFKMRALIRVQAGAVEIPAGYSVSLNLDHAGLVKAGASLVNGDDVRIAQKEGDKWVELDRVLDPGSEWNKPDTKLWFRLSSTIPAGGDDLSAYLYYGHDASQGAPSPPPAEGSKVHLLFEDFESGNLDQWATVNGSAWSSDAAMSHRGARALKHGSLTNSAGRWLVAKDVDASDVAMEAYWRITAVSDMDIAQGVRSSSSPLQQYESNLESTNGWDIAKFVNNKWSELVSQPGGQDLKTNEWFRMTTVIRGQRMKVFRDGLQLVPSSKDAENADVGAEISSGSAGVRVYRVPPGQAFWIDDVIVRRYVDPEPTASVTEAEGLP